MLHALLANRPDTNRLLSHEPRLTFQLGIDVSLRPFSVQDGQCAGNIMRQGSQDRMPCLPCRQACNGCAGGQCGSRGSVPVRRGAALRGSPPTQAVRRPPRCRLCSEGPFSPAVGWVRAFRFLMKRCTANNVVQSFRDVNIPRI